MTYQDITQYNSPNMTPGRPWGINKIVIHWWGDPNTHPTFEGVIQTLCSPARGASAHYVVEAGRVACIVDPDNRAWHAGDGIGNGSQGNDRGIGIECNPRQSDGDYQTIAELIRDLRKVYGDLPLHPHREFNATACPGTYDLARLDRLARGQATTPAPQPAPAPAVNIDDLARRAIRGEFGNGDQRRQALGANYDAVQARVNQLLGNNQPAPAPAVNIDDLARRTIRGEFGNGAQRRQALGANYDAVQARVNQLLS